MEENRSILNFDCNEININPEDFWDEIIQLAFLGGDSESIVVVRLAYEDEIYIEHNDQINFLYSFYKDVVFKLDDSCLIIEVLKPTMSSNLANKIVIKLNVSTRNLQRILDQLVADTVADG